MSAIIHDRYDDLYLRRILRETRTIAMVGASANWNRPSYFAMKYLLDRGYKVLPVNPAALGQEILGQKVYRALADLPHKADMVDIFRNSQAAGPITDDAIAHGVKVVWMQIGVRNDAAAQRAEAAGLKVVMNRCPKIEHSRLSGTIEWHGIASGVHHPGEEAGTLMSGPTPRCHPERSRKGLPSLATKACGANVRSLHFSADQLRATSGRPKKGREVRHLRPHGSRRRFAWPAIR